VIRVEAGMSTTRFTRLIDMPERTWRRWQAHARRAELTGEPTRGPWPMPVSERVEPTVVKHAEARPAWGHRKVWAMTRYDGLVVSQATVLRVMRRRGLLLEAAYQRERRQLAAARKAAFVVPPTAANQGVAAGLQRVRDTSAPEFAQPARTAAANAASGH